MMRQQIVEAIQQGNITFVQNLSAEALKTAEEEEGQGPSLVLLACYYQKSTLAQLLAAKKSELSIFEAAALGDLDEVTKQLSQTPNLLNAFATDGFTPLGLACFFGHPKLVKALLAAGAQANLASNNDFKVAPLHSAAARQQLDIAQMLLDAGADVNAKQQSGVSPLHSAANNADLLMVQLLLAAGADATAKMQDGKTALDFAKEKEAGEIVQLLTNVK